LGLSTPARCGGSKPPDALVELERQVGLKVAHARGVGPVDPDKRKLLLAAERYEGKGEQALKAGDYVNAGNYFERAKDLLDQLGI